MFAPEESREQSLDALLRTCIDTQAPSGHEGRFLNNIREVIEQSGTDAEILQGPWGMAIVWPASGGSKQNLRLLDGHVDRVSANPQDWTSDPFKTRIDGDRYYGRGSVDQLGGVAAALQAAVELAQSVPQAKRKRPFGVILSAAEEVAEGWGPQCAIRALYKNGWTVNSAVITEASNNDVMTGQMGRARYRVESKHPDVLVRLALILEETYRKVAKITGQEQALTLLCGNLKSECDATVDSQIPSRAVATFECSEGAGIENIAILVSLLPVLQERNLAESVNITYTGRILKVEVTGKTAHSAFKEQGKNAGIALAKIIRAISESPNDFSGLSFVSGTIGDGTLEGSGGNTGQLFYDHRTDIGENPSEPDGVIDMIRSRIVSISQDLGVSSDDSTVDLHTQTIDIDEGAEQVEIPQFFPAWETCRSGRLYRDMATSIESTTGNIRERAWGFCTGGSGYTQEHIPLIGIGPGDEKLAHQTDEFVPFSEVKKTTDILFELLRRYVCLK